MAERLVKDAKRKTSAMNSDRLPPNFFERFQSCPPVLHPIRALAFSLHLLKQTRTAAQLTESSSIFEIIRKSIFKTNPKALLFQTPNFRLKMSLNSLGNSAESKTAKPLRGGKASISSCASPPSSGSRPGEIRTA
jgi:hypothetical protein